MKVVNRRSEFALSKAEVQRLYNAPPNFRDRVIVKLLYFCGLRRSELIYLNIEDVDFNKKRLVIRHGKGDKVRTIPFIDLDVISDLKHLIGGKRSGAVFLSSLSGDRLSLRQVNWVVEQAGKRAGLRHPNPLMGVINPHLLRHSIARHLKSAGYSAEWIQKFLGHASIKTTMDSYGTIGIDEMQAVAYRKMGIVSEESKVKMLGDGNE